MDNQNPEQSKFEGTPEIQSFNIADFELLYNKLEDEDAELYGGGYFLDNLNPIRSDICPMDMYGGQCPAAVSTCYTLMYCEENGEACVLLKGCGNNNYVDDGCRWNADCYTLLFCRTNGTT